MDKKQKEVYVCLKCGSKEGDVYQEFFKTGLCPICRKTGILTHKKVTTNEE